METIFDTWMSGATKLNNEWKRMADGWSAEPNKLWENAGKMQQQWLSSYQEMLKMMSSNSNNVFNTFSHDTTREAFSNMLKSMDVYTRLFQLWQPMFSQMQHNTFNPQEFWKMVDPAQFRSFVDNLFGMDRNKMMQSFMEQYNKLMPVWMSGVEQAGKNYMQFLSNSGPLFNATSGMDPQAIANWFTEMGRSAQRSFFPYFTQTSNGSQPSVEPFSDMMNRWGTYMSKVSQMQNLLYKASMTAWEKTAQAMTDRSKEGKPVQDFNTFYNEWSTINEQEYVALFNTEEYAKLQGEVLALQAEMAKHYEKGMESLLQPYPIVLRSQLDEVYKTVHELRTRINELERQLAEFQRASRGGAAKGDKLPTKE